MIAHAKNEVLHSSPLRFTVKDASAAVNAIETGALNRIGVTGSSAGSFMLDVGVLDMSFNTGSNIVGNFAPIDRSAEGLTLKASTSIPIDGRLRETRRISRRTGVTGRHWKVK